MPKWSNWKIPLSIHVALNHVTHYRYDRAVELSPQLVRLRPAPHCRTPILSYSQRITPAEHFLNWQQDPQSNYVARLDVSRKGREFRVEIDLVAEMAVYNPFDFFLEPSRRTFAVPYDRGSCASCSRFCGRTADAAVRRLSRGIARERQRTIDLLVDVNQRLQRDIRYLIRLDPGVQYARNARARIRFVPGHDVAAGAAPAAARAGGAVRLGLPDPAHAGCQGARRSGGRRARLHRPACLVRGLPAGRRMDRPRSDLRACWPAKDTSRSPARPSRPAPRRSRAASNTARSSSTTRCRSSASSSRRASPSRTRTPSGRRSSPRPRGRRRSAAGDVRLTMGGEPTFVSVTDRDADEWNTAALGPTKRVRATELLWRLKEHFGANGFVHFGQGKWYPGEQLPRWALGCYWRADGEPAWTDPSLFADEAHPTATVPTMPSGSSGAGRASRPDRRHVQAGLRGRLVLPVARAPAAGERRSVRRAPGRRARARSAAPRLHAGLDTVVGYALPLGA